MEEMLVLRMTGLVSLAMTAAMLPSLAYALNGEPEMVAPFLGTKYRFTAEDASVDSGWSVIFGIILALHKYSGLYSLYRFR